MERKNIKRIYDCVIHPKDLNICPIYKNDCDNCEYREYIGTLGGEYYIECNHPLLNQ